jgi:hypothetical protein
MQRIICGQLLSGSRSVEQQRMVLTQMPTADPLTACNLYACLPCHSVLGAKVVQQHAAACSDHRIYIDIDIGYALLHVCAPQSTTQVISTAWTAAVAHPQL